MNSGSDNFIIELERLGKTYRAGKVDVPALRDVTLGVGKAEFISIAGPSGCGKSTLLHLIAGLTRPTTGSVRIEGQEIRQLTDAELSRIRGNRIGFVFQRFNLLPTLSIVENIAIAQKIRSSSDQNRSGIGEILELVGLAAKGDRKPAELSMGEQQRAAIARAIIHRPSILLADEPTGNLDTTNSTSVMKIFSQMNRELGQTILLVTHNGAVAATANRIINMKDGRIVQPG